jgi:hypothetical protein
VLNQLLRLPQPASLEGAETSMGMGEFLAFVSLRLLFCGTCDSYRSEDFRLLRKMELMSEITQRINNVLMRTSPCILSCIGSRASALPS